LNPDPFDANEELAVGQRGPLWLDSSSRIFLERLAKPDVATYRAMMASHLAPQNPRFVGVIWATLIEGLFCSTCPRALPIRLSETKRNAS
jgi:hypothetical protein